MLRILPSLIPYFESAPIPIVSIISGRHLFSTTFLIKPSLFHQGTGDNCARDTESSV